LIQARVTHSNDWFKNCAARAVWSVNLRGSWKTGGRREYQGPTAELVDKDRDSSLCEKSIDHRDKGTITWTAARWGLYHI